ncbi:MAG: APC family permease [Sedimenticola sp.]|nr:APC family permease [Sedimenticola sp.]
MLTDNSQLKRTLSLPVVTLYGLGTIIGAGIYVLIGEVAAHAGYLTPLAFLLAALIAGFSAFSYAELSSRFPVSAGEAVYVQRAFGVRAWSTVIGLLMASVGIIASATLARGFSGYLDYILPLDPALSMTLLVLILGAVAAWGISESAWLAVVTTLVEIGGLLLIVWVAGENLTELPDLVASGLELSDGPAWQQVAAGAFIAFFAFLGFEDIVNVGEEVRNPSRNLPLAVILSLLISALLYLAITLVSVATVPPGELAGNPAPLALVYESAVGSSPLFIVLVSIAAIVNGILIMLVMATRILYGMSRQEWLPARLCRVSPVTHTPLFSTLLVTLLILAFALWLPIATLAAATSLITLVVFFSVNLSLLTIRWRDGKSSEPPPDIVRYPIGLPVAGLLSSGAFLLVQLANWMGT